MAYQDTAGASKRNAFCWATGASQIDVRRLDRSAATSARQTELVEQRRAEGVDLLHLPGMGSSARHDPTDVTRRAIKTRKGKRNGR